MVSVDSTNENAVAADVVERHYICSGGWHQSVDDGHPYDELAVMLKPLSFDTWKHQDMTQGERDVGSVLVREGEVRQWCRDYNVPMFFQDPEVNQAFIFTLKDIPHQVMFKLRFSI